jgi:hypothetical protein
LGQLHLRIRTVAVLIGKVATIAELVPVQELITAIKRAVVSAHLRRKQLHQQKNHQVVVDDNSASARY